MGLLCAARPGGGAEQLARTECVYFGKGSTTSGDRIVKNTCPPFGMPVARLGVYYFKLDFDPGGASETLKDAALVSPADSVCDDAAGKCSAPEGPGYDLYVAKGCLPVPGAPGLGDGNTGRATRKPLELSSSSFVRYYIAVVMRNDTDYGSKRCSFTIYPGSLGAGKAQKCAIMDYTPHGTITTATITTTVNITTFNSTTNHTASTVTSSSVVRQSTTAKPGESMGTDTKTSTDGELVITTVTTIKTSTVLSQTPENVDFCEPKSQPIPPEYIFATIVVACLGAAICVYFYVRWDQRRAMRRVLVEREKSFREELNERSLSQSVAIESNMFQISEVVRAREERNLSIRSQRLGTGTVLVRERERESQRVSESESWRERGCARESKSESHSKSERERERKRERARKRDSERARARAR